VNKQGTVYERKDGRWVAALSLDSRQRVTRYCATRAAAEEALAQLVQLRERGRLSQTGRQTLATYLAQWLANKHASVRDHTFVMYRAQLAHVIIRLGHVRLSDLQPGQIRALGTALLDTGYATATVNQCLVILKMALRDAEADGLIDRSPGAHVRPPRINQEERRWLSSSQVRAFLRSSTESEWYALWMLLLDTGMRIGEATALRWSEVDSDAGTILVLATVTHRTGQGAVRGEPKTPCSRRLLHLGPDTLAALKTHSPAVKRRRASTRGWVDQDLVFPNTHGGFLCVKQVNICLMRDLGIAGLPRFTAHELRHTMASQWLNDGEDVRVVQERLGHASAAMTLDIYGHVAPAMHREAAQRAANRRRQTS